MSDHGSKCSTVKLRLVSHVFVAVQRRSVFLLVTLGGLTRVARASVNHDEAKVAPYTLPDPLTFRSGTKLASPDQWPKRRAEILALFEDQMYGLIPPRPAKMRLELLESSDVLGGRATRKQVRMWFRDDNSGPKIDWIFFLPKNRSGPVPAFIGLNYYGNQELDADPAIRRCEGWLRDNPKHFVTDHRTSEKSRGLDPKTWPFETLVTRGYALVTACYGDIAPDDKELYTQGVHVLFPPTAPGVGNNTTALAAWAWGLMRGMDMLEKEPAIDARRVAVIGCSRLAKAALLAGAKDERFAVVIANQTGGGGVPLAKRDYGENVSTQNQMFPGSVATFASTATTRPPCRSTSTCCWRPAPRAGSMSPVSPASGSTPTASSSA